MCTSTCPNIRCAFRGNNGAISVTVLRIRTVRSKRSIRRDISFVSLTPARDSDDRSRNLIRPSLHLGLLTSFLIVISIWYHFLRWHSRERTLRWASLGPFRPIPLTSFVDGYVLVPPTVPDRGAFLAGSRTRSTRASAASAAIAGLAQNSGSG